MRKYLSLLLVILLFGLPESQAQNRPARINVKTDFVHRPTAAVFPVKLDRFSRTVLYTYDPAFRNLAANYFNDNGIGRTYVSVYLYEAGESYEGRFREEFLTSLRSVIDESKWEKDVVMYSSPYSRDDKKVDGFSAEILNNYFGLDTRISLYDCGDWFLLIQVSSGILDPEGMEEVKALFLEHFDPLDLVSKDR